MISKIRMPTEDGYAELTLRKTHMPRKIDAYDLLVEAICRRASNDLLHGTYEQKTDAMDFFRSKWFEDLTDGELDGEYIIQQLLDGR